MNRSKDTPQTNTSEGNVTILDIHGVGAHLMQCGATEQDARMIIFAIRNIGAENLEDLLMVTAQTIQHTIETRTFIPKDSYIRWMLEDYDSGGHFLNPDVAKLSRAAFIERCEISWGINNHMQNDDYLNNPHFLSSVVLDLKKIFRGSSDDLRRFLAFVGLEEKDGGAQIRPEDLTNNHAEKLRSIAQLIGPTWKSMSFSGFNQPADPWDKSAAFPKLIPSDLDRKLARGKEYRLSVLRDKIAKGQLVEDGAKLFVQDMIDIYIKNEAAKMMLINACNVFYTHDPIPWPLVAARVEDAIWDESKSGT